MVPKLPLGMKARLLILLALFGLQLPKSLAQQKPSPSAAASYALAGTVLDPSGAVIPGAQVALTKFDGAKVADAETDSTGSFHFENLRAAKYQLVVRAGGFQDARSEVSLGAKPSVKVRITVSITARGTAMIRQPTGRDQTMIGGISSICWDRLNQLASSLWDSDWPSILGCL